MIDGTDPTIDPTADPVGYDSATRTFSVYSESYSLLGSHEVSVLAYLVEYPYVESWPSYATIEFIDPCLDPFSVNAEA